MPRAAGAGHAADGRPTHGPHAKRAGQARWESIPLLPCTPSSCGIPACSWPWPVACLLLPLPPPMPACACFSGELSGPQALHPYTSSSPRPSACRRRLAVPLLLQPQLPVARRLQPVQAPQARARSGAGAGWRGYRAGAAARAGGQAGRLEVRQLRQRQVSAAAGWLAGRACLPLALL